jgi:hypothetical protein
VEAVFVALLVLAAATVACGSGYLVVTLYRRGV